GPVRLQHRLVGVTEEGDLEILRLTKLRELLRLVGGDADDVVARAGEQFEVVGEVARLFGAPGRKSGRVEVDDHLAAGVLGERDLLAVGVGQGEGGGGVAGGESLAHGSGSPRRDSGRSVAYDTSRVNRVPWSAPRAE